MAEFKVEFWGTLIISNVFFATEKDIQGTIWFAFAILILILNLTIHPKKNLKKK